MKDERPLATWVYGVRPVEELLARRPGAVERLFVARRQGGAGRILGSARRAGIPVTYLERDLLSRKIGGRAAHQGIAARVAPVGYAEPDAVCQAASTPGGQIVFVDRVVDPGNLGAIVRTCAAAGVAGILLSARDTAGLTAHVMKASAGALESLPVAREPRPGRRLAALRRAGFRAVALDPRGEQPWDRVDLRGNVAWVVGGEARGARRGLLEECDIRVAIPLHPGVESLNVAVSLGVLLFEALRQRRTGP